VTGNECWNDQYREALFNQGLGVVSILVRFVFKRHKESIMNRFLATTAAALLLGAAPGLAQTPASPNAAQQPPMQAPMQPEPPSAIPSETSPKSLDQSSEAAKPIAPDQSTEAAKPIAPEQSAQFLTEQKPDELLASKLIGKPAVNSQDETIGNVNDFVTDRSGKVIGALIGVGGFLGIGEKHVAVRFEDLKFTRDDNDNVKVTLNISKEMLASAPAYKTVEEQPVVEGSAKTDREDNTRTY
jgi:type IV secretory pathway VirB10-like protein